MSSKHFSTSRRSFLKQSAGISLASLAGVALPRMVYSASRDRITILTSVSLDTLHPYAYTSAPQYSLWMHMIQPLVDIDYSKKQYVGVLAESWEFQGNKWTFKLRKNVRFHDGSPFTAKDVIHSINRVKNDKQSMQGPAFSDLVEMQSPDDHTVVFTTKQPNAVFLDRLDNRFMISKAAADKHGEQADQNPLGTGPYKFVSWQRDGNLVLSRNDDYWGPKAAIKEIVIKRVKEDAARVAGVMAGQGDVMNNVPVEELSRFDKHPRLRAEKVEGQRMYFLAMNVTHKPFDSKLVRQAINYAVDPNAIIKHIYEGNGYLMNGPTGTNVIGFDPKINATRSIRRKPKSCSHRQVFPTASK